MGCFPQNGADQRYISVFVRQKEGTTVTVKYREKGGEKTAVGIKDASKATAKTVAQ
jgi:hypothetical protein